MTVYNDAFYDHQLAESEASAAQVLPALFARFKPQSVIDIGCGLGSWLKICGDLGIADIRGMDGDYVNVQRLRIPRDKFLMTDLSQSIHDTRRYDLAMTLEVAEHLPPNRAESFVEDLTRLSDVVLFSAAVPLQGGTGHVNENWLEYWAILFRRHGYVAVDFLRDELWQRHEICWWYRQNVILFVKADKAAALFNVVDATPRPLTRLHPDLYLWAAVRPNAHYKPDYHANIRYHGLLVRAYLDGMQELPEPVLSYGQEFEVKYDSDNA